MNGWVFFRLRQLKTPAQNSKNRNILVEFLPAQGIPFNLNLNSLGALRP